LDRFEIERCAVDLCDRSGVQALVEGMDHQFIREFIRVRLKY